MALSALLCILLIATAKRAQEGVWVDMPRTSALSSTQPPNLQPETLQPNTWLLKVFQVALGNLQGMLALGSMRAGALAFHVVLGAMFAAALGAHNSSEYSELEIQCVLS